MNWAILNKTKIKEKILEEMSPYSHPPGEMFVVITEHYKEDGGYAVMSLGEKGKRLYVKS